MIGANKDGWWDEIKLMHQSEDVLDFLEAWDTENKYQFIGHFDQSVAHNKKNANALVRKPLPYLVCPLACFFILLCVLLLRSQPISVSLGEASNGNFVIVLFFQVFWASSMYLPKCIIFLEKEPDSGRRAQNGLISHVWALARWIWL